MSANIAAQQNLAERFGDALRLYEAEGGDVHKLAERVGEEARDLRRWADGTKMPGHVLVLLLGALPRHLADRLIAPSGLRLISREQPEQTNALRAAASASAFSSDVANRMADGVWDHRDESAARDHARRVITDLQSVAGE